MDVRVGQKKEWAPRNWCFQSVVLEKTLESPLDCKEIQPVHPKGDQPWVFIEGTDAGAETPVLWLPDAKLTHWKRPWCWEGLGAGGEGDDRGWDGWMASLTWCTWVWVDSRSWWWTGRPGVLRFMGSQRVGHDWAAELNWIRCWALGLYKQNPLPSKIKEVIFFLLVIFLDVPLSLISNKQGQAAICVLREPGTGAPFILSFVISLSPRKRSCV